jgi:flagellar biosynthesis/type III secretory pathway protein FliH
MGKKKYPAQLRYEAKNPAITFRMKKYEKEMIQEMAKKSGKSVSELVRYALLNLQKDFSESYNKTYNDGHKKGYDEGYEKGKKNGYKNGYENGTNEWAIWVPCYNCWKPLFIKPNTDDHKKTIDEMKGRLKHITCPD